ncbi:thioredoxin family protein [Roseateles oligotrophus]|uniref:Thioredoxin family protein n=1 Tax=Roseateles oligotrophus TaxID=1769250 RepID=A0ABT2YEH5_9BURK|nr:thioredoxin family protein [Roseateles oligotrophus]MCV2368424.1 thioredoxin family protein [Roseateles oligotrophus]
MKNIATAVLLVSLFSGLPVQAQGQPAAPASAASAPKQIYSETADARAELNQALARAQAQQKNVLVVFGANWCGDCVALDKKMSAGSLAEHVGKRLVVLKVNVGRFDRNTDLAAQIGVSLKKGIPAVAVLKRDGEVLRATSGGELADARNMGDEAVLAVLEGLHARQ